MFVVHWEVRCTWKTPYTHTHTHLYTNSLSLSLSLSLTFSLSPLSVGRKGDLIVFVVHGEIRCTWKTPYTHTLIHKHSHSLLSLSLSLSPLSLSPLSLSLSLCREKRRPDCVCGSWGDKMHLEDTIHTHTLIHKLSLSHTHTHTSLSLYHFSGA